MPNPKSDRIQASARTILRRLVCVAGHYQSSRGAIQRSIKGYYLISLQTELSNHGFPALISTLATDRLTRCAEGFSSSNLTDMLVSIILRGHARITFKISAEKEGVVVSDLLGNLLDRIPALQQAPAGMIDSFSAQPVDRS
jgi:hypothetical protein